MSTDSLNSICRLEDRLDMTTLTQAQWWLNRAVDMTNRQLDSPKELSAARTLILSDLRRVVDVLDSVISLLDKSSASGSW
jgi:hypothetical protein